MKKYVIFIEGENFLLDFNDEETAMGFFITKCVHANSKEKAKELAFHLLRKEPKLSQAFRRSGILLPTMVAHVIHELLQGSKMKDTKFTFFPIEKNDF